MEFETHFFNADDGVRLAWHEAGEGRPVILIHGLFSNAQTNWVKYGTAAKIAEQGFRLIMPDLRAHGQSAKPHDPAAYPKDVLADDALALIRHLGLQDGEYDLGGYSLGGRTTMRALIKGAKPQRAIMAGMGLQGLLDTGARADHFRFVLEKFHEHQRGTDAWLAAQFLKTMGGDPEALIHILDTFVNTDEASLQSINLPVLVVSGVDDHDNGSSEALAQLLPNAEYTEIPGNHMTAVTKAELGDVIAAYLVG